MIIGAIKKVGVAGNALAIFITKEAQMAGIKKGDYVRIVFEKEEINEPNLHDHCTAQQDPKARVERTDKDA